MLPATLVLIRHCEAQGQPAEAPLTPAGREQARHLVQALAAERIDRIVSSPFRRALQSVQPLASARALEIVPDPRLIERVLSAEPRPDWRERLRDSFEDLDLRLPGGETSREAMMRGREVVEQYAHGGGHTVLVSHGNLLALLLRSFHAAHGFDTWAGLNTPDAYRLTFRAGDVRMERLPLP